MGFVNVRVADAADEGGLVVAGLAKNSESTGTDIDTEAGPKCEEGCRKRSTHL